MKSRKLTIALFVFYFLVLSTVILLKNTFSFSFLHIRFMLAGSEVRRSVNLIPLGGMQVLNGARDFNEVIYNVLAFIPFGIFLSMLQKKKSFAGLILPIVLTSLSYEVIQYIFGIGASDITDLLANSLGGLIGIGLFFVLQKVCGEHVNKVINIIALVLSIGLLLCLSMVRPI